MKADFALDKCLGGVMVWAISHDTKDGKYSEALGEAVPRSGGNRVEHEAATLDMRGQCKWTNCGECNAAYSPLVVPLLLVFQENRR